MPLHVIHTAKGVLSPKDKEAIAESITKVYSQLPPFYVVVTFYESDFFFIGGKHNNKFVRIVTQHLARDYSTPDATDKILDAIQACYHPYVRDRGLDWEIHIEWTGRESWRENGMKPPMPGTEAEKLWIKEDKPIPFDPATGGLA